MENIRIEEVKQATAESVAAVNGLLDQLTSTAVVFGLAELQRLVNAETSRLFFIYCENEVVGMLTLGSYYTPTGPKCWVEDVVVDEQFRGRAFGKKLLEYAISQASLVPGNQLMLTSKPVRIAANALYRSVGFQAKETNVYRMTFDK